MRADNTSFLPACRELGHRQPLRQQPSTRPVTVSQQVKVYYTARTVNRIIRQFDRSDGTDFLVGGPDCCMPRETQGVDITRQKLRNRRDIVISLIATNTAVSQEDEDSCLAVTEFTEFRSRQCYDTDGMISPYNAHYLNYNCFTQFPVQVPYKYEV